MSDLNNINSKLQDGTEYNYDFWEGVFLLLKMQDYQITDYYGSDLKTNSNFIDIKLVSLASNKIHIFNSKEYGCYMWVGILASVERDFIESFIVGNLDWNNSKDDEFNKLISLTYFLEAVNNRRNETSCINIFYGYFYQILDEVLRIAEERTFSHPQNKIELVIERTFKEFHSFIAHKILPILELNPKDSNLEYIDCNALSYRYSADIEVIKFDEDVLIELPNKITVCSHVALPYAIAGMAINREVDHIIKSHFANTGLDLFTRVEPNNLNVYKVSVGFNEPSIEIAVMYIRQDDHDCCSFTGLNHLTRCFEFDAIDVLASVYIQVAKAVSGKPKTWNLTISLVTTHLMDNKNSFKVNADIQVFMEPEHIVFQLEKQLSSSAMDWFTQSVEVKYLLAGYLNNHYDLNHEDELETSENFYIKENNVYLPYSEILECRAF